MNWKVLILGFVFYSLTQASRHVHVFVSLEPAGSCFESAILRRFAARGKAHGWTHRDTRPVCHRHPDRCEKHLCSVTEEAYIRGSKSLNGKGERLRPPQCIDVASHSVISGFFGYCKATISYRDSKETCMNLVAVREPLRRLVLQYRSDCLLKAIDDQPLTETESTNRSVPCGQAGFVHWARSNSNHYTRVLAHRRSPSTQNINGRQLHVACQKLSSGISVILPDLKQDNGAIQTERRHDDDDPQTPNLTWIQLAKVLGDSTALLDGALKVSSKEPDNLCTSKRIKQQQLFVPTAEEVRIVKNLNHFDISLYRSLVKLSIARGTRGIIIGSLPNTSSTIESKKNMKHGIQGFGQATLLPVARSKSSSSKNISVPLTQGHNQTNTLSNNFYLPATTNSLHGGIRSDASTLDSLPLSGIDIETLRIPLASNHANNFKIIERLSIAVIISISAFFVLHNCIKNGLCLMRHAIKFLRHCCRLSRRCRALVSTFRWNRITHSKITGRLSQCCKLMNYNNLKEATDCIAGKQGYKQRANLPRKPFSSNNANRGAIVGAERGTRGVGSRSLSRRGASAAKAAYFFEQEQLRNHDPETLYNEDHDVVEMRINEDSEREQIIDVKKSIELKDRNWEQKRVDDEKEINEFSAFLVRAKLTKHERWLRAAGFAEVHDLADATEEDIIAAQREYQRKENSDEKQNIEGLLMKKPESRRLRRAVTKEMAKLLNGSTSESSRNSFASTKELLSKSSPSISPSADFQSSPKAHLKSEKVLERRTKPSAAIKIEQPYVDHRKANMPKADFVQEIYSRPQKDQQTPAARVAQQRALEELQRESESTPWAKFQRIATEDYQPSLDGRINKKNNNFSHWSDRAKSKPIKDASRKDICEQHRPSEQRGIKSRSQFGLQLTFSNDPKDLEQTRASEREASNFPSRPSILDSSSESSEITYEKVNALDKVNELADSAERTAEELLKWQSKSAFYNAEQVPFIYNEDDDPILAKARKLLADYKPAGSLFHVHEKAAKTKP